MNYGISPDFGEIFEALPKAYLILTPDFIMVAANDAYCKLTRMNREQLVGKYVFDVFPDDPDNPSATGVADLTKSFNKVLKTKLPDIMPALRYDIPSEKDENIFETKYWRLVNSPQLDINGEVVHLINCVEEVTHLVEALGEAMTIAKSEETN